MSLYEFQSDERIDGQTIADVDAEISHSEEYALWTEEGDTPRETEIHFLRLETEFIPPDDRALIETLYEDVFGDTLFIGRDGHAYVGVKRWQTPDGDEVGADEFMDRLLKVL